MYLLTACSTSVTSDHANQKHSITCKTHTKLCYDKASNLCTDGYLVTNRVRPKKVNEDTVYTLNIKCRSGSIY
jgi:hypothetical protein